MSLPRYNIANVFKLRKKILEDLDVIGFLDATPAGMDFDEFVGLLHRLLPKRIPRETIYDSCMALVGEKLTKQVLDDLAWRLAGNVRRLRNGHPVLPWDGQMDLEWVPVQVLEVGIAASRRGKVGGSFLLKVLAGQSCPNEFHTFWTKKFCHTFARNLGFSRWNSGPHPLDDVRQMVNFRFYASIVPETSVLKLEQITESSSFRDWNANYLQRRKRTTGKFDCPRDFHLELRCHHCFVGQDECAVSLHPTTYFKWDCPECCQEKWFEDERDTICVDCKIVNAIKRKDQLP